jgi:hypothetical protein
LPDDGSGFHRTERSNFDVGVNHGQRADHGGGVDADVHAGASVRVKQRTGNQPGNVRLRCFIG